MTGPRSIREMIELQETKPYKDQIKKVISKIQKKYPGRVAEGQVCAELRAEGFTRVDGVEKRFQKGELEAEVTETSRVSLKDKFAVVRFKAPSLSADYQLDGQIRYFEEAAK